MMLYADYKKEHECIPSIHTKIHADRVFKVIENKFIRSSGIKGRTVPSMFAECKKMLAMPASSRDSFEELIKRWCHIDNMGFVDYLLVGKYANDPDPLNQCLPTTIPCITPSSMFGDYRDLLLEFFSEQFDSTMKSMIRFEKQYCEAICAIQYISSVWDDLEQDKKDFITKEYPLLEMDVPFLQVSNNPCYGGFEQGELTNNEVVLIIKIVNGVFDTEYLESAIDSIETESTKTNIERCFIDDFNAWVMNYKKPASVAVARMRIDHTLEEVGTTYGYTRERARQIQKAIVVKFSSFLKEESKYFGGNVLNNITSGITCHKQQIIESDEENGALLAFFLEEVKDAALAYAEGTEYYVLNEELHSTLVEEIKKLTYYINKDDVQTTIEQVAAKLDGSGITEQDVKNCFFANYKEKDGYFIQLNASNNKNAKLEHIMKECFQDGLSLSNYEHIDRLNRAWFETYGEDISFKPYDGKSKDHRLSGLIERANVMLCSKGTYKLRELCPYVPEDLILKMIEMLDEKQRPVGYDEFMYRFKDELSACGVSNKFELQGNIIEYLNSHDAGIERKRDYLTKKNFKSNSVREAMIAWMEEQDVVFSRADFAKEFSGYKDYILSFRLDEVDFLTTLFGRGYLNINKAGLTGDDIQAMENICNELIENSEHGFINVQLFLDKLEAEHKDVIAKTHIELAYDANDLLKYFHEDKFQFSYPLIGKKGTKLLGIEEIVLKYGKENKAIILESLKNHTTLILGEEPSISTFVDILAKTHVAMDGKTMVANELFGPLKNELAGIKYTLRTFLDVDDTIILGKDLVDSKVIETIAGHPANKWMLYSIIKGHLSDEFEVEFENPELRIFKGSDFVVRKK